MSQKSALLELLKAHKKVYCGDLARVGLYHSAAKRKRELILEGHNIHFVKGNTWADSYYELKEEYKMEANGQFRFV